MNSLIAVSIALIFVIPIALALLLRRSRKTTRCAYQANRLPFTPEERTLFAALKDAVGGEFEILGRIRIGDIIQPREKADRRNAPSAFKKLAEQSFLFVLCNPRDLSVAGVVERSVKEPRGSAREEGGRLQALCSAAEVPLILIGPDACRDRDELRAIVMEALIPRALPVGQNDGRKEPHISSIEDLNLE